MYLIKTKSLANHVFTRLCFGGDKGIRTPDLLHAKQPLSQLSYTPDENIIAYFSKVIKYFGKILFEK